jgi:hypothetical protein
MTATLVTLPTLPAGDYLIIDPCYVYTGTRWDALSRVMCALPTPYTGIVTDPVTGCAFAFSFTAAGDGIYSDHEGHRYGVDSGSLACLPLAMLDAATLARLPTRDRSIDQVCRGRWVTFTTAWVCRPCDAQGVIRFGHLVIHT